MTTEDSPGPAAGHTFDWHPEPALVDFHEPAARAELNELGERTWALAMEYLYDEALTRPVGPLTYPELRQAYFGSTGLPGPMPAAPMTSERVLDEIRERMAPFGYNSQHLRSFSYFTTPPLPMSAAGDALAAWLHQSVDVFHASPIGTLVEEEVAAWLRDLVGAGPDGWAVLTSGGVMANIMAMTVARDIALPRMLDLDRPPRGAQLDGVRVYCSDQAHFSIRRALDVLGFPGDTLHVVDSDPEFRLPVGAVADAVAGDRAAGLRPLAIAAVSGSTNTGTLDPVPGLADLAEREGMWLHVDAAYGGAALLSERDARLVEGLDRADSVTVDPHKWFFQAFDIGALVVRRREDLHGTFIRRPEYYRSNRPQDDATSWMEYSIEGTRRFRALKLWMSWKHLGTRGFGRLVERTNDLAAELSALLRTAPDFELAVDPPDLSIVCFRHRPDGVADPVALDDHQDRLQRALEESGRAWVSTTRLRGATWLRAGVVNHMSTTADLEALLSSLRELASSH
ncbi:MAG TPA: pyridoxal-dependent decarboxylase [Mycobacteriales bacterium]|nr:pyridoxal-dependent decarboxylase [Mycobacteriales bacterium]